MRNATDYYNLLSDTLRSGYHQIEKIYNKIPDAKKENRYINIRTGYLMNKRDFRNNNYRFVPRIKYPICYNMQYCGCADFFVIDKILWKYSNWLDIYSTSKDTNYIKYLVEKEKNDAKNEKIRQEKNGEDDFILFQRNHSDSESESYYYKKNKNDNSSFINSLDSFIVSDEEIEDEEKEIEDDEIEIISDNENEDNKIKKNDNLNKNNNNKNNILIIDDDEEDELEKELDNLSDYNKKINKKKLSDKNNIDSYIIDESEESYDNFTSNKKKRLKVISDEDDNSNNITLNSTGKKEKMLQQKTNRSNIKSIQVTLDDFLIKQTNKNKK